MRPADGIVQKLRNQIRPILEMLKSKRSELNDNAWTKQVKETEQNIINSPGEYLSEQLQKEILTSAIQQVFKQFVDESI